MGTNVYLKIKSRAVVLPNYFIIIRVRGYIIGDIHKPTIIRSIGEHFRHSIDGIGFDLISSSIDEIKGNLKYSIELSFRNNRDDLKNKDFMEYVKNIIERKIHIILLSDRKEMTGSVKYLIEDRLGNLVANEKAK